MEEAMRFFGMQVSIPSLRGKHQLDENEYLQRADKVRRSVELAVIVVRKTCHLGVYLRRFLNPTSVLRRNLQSPCKAYRLPKCFTPVESGHALGSEKTAEQISFLMLGVHCNKV